MEYLLQMHDICKKFPGVVALDKAQLNLRAGTVHALMGENGAGKSTLMKCLFGIYTKDSGVIKINGVDIDFQNPKQAMEQGVAMVHQELQQLTKRTVVENLFMGRYMTKFGLIKQKAMYDRTKGILDKLEINIDPNTILSKLSVSQRQMVEIAKAVSYNAKILVLDEPTSSLQTAECEHLFRIIKSLKETGVGIIYISHKMDEILRISDEVTVMRDGKFVATTAAKDLTMELIIKQMIGRELGGRFPIKDNVVGDTVLQVDDLVGAYQPSVQNVSFELKKGEILGLAGLVGSRRSETLESIFGLRKLANGTIKYNGKVLHNTTPKKAIKNGFALLTEERKSTGIFGVLPIKFNAVSANFKKYQKFGWLSDKGINKDTDWVINSMSVKTPSKHTKIGLLSGGNQQKVILGRWLLTEPKVLMLDEPTRGIDVGAKYEIYQLIIELAKKGNSIIVVSSEMEELQGICDRMVVMSNGRVAGEVNPKTSNQEEIMTLAAKYV